MESRFRDIMNLITVSIMLVFVALSFARLLGAPLALAVVAGRSMEPSYMLGDLVILVKKQPRIGDVVLWCTGYTHCVVHRLIDIQDGMAVTKGDANPVPDQPVPLSAVKYVVVARIPRIAVAAIIAPLAVYWLTNMARAAATGIEAVEAASVFAVILYIMFTLGAPVLAPIPPQSSPIESMMPMITLKRIALERGSILVKYNVENTVLMDIHNCTVAGDGITGHCSPYLLPGDTVYVHVPQLFYQELFMKGVTEYKLSFTATLSYGLLLADYTVRVPWKKPILKLNCTAIVVENMNPVPLDVNTTIYYLDAIPGPGTRYEESNLQNTSLKVDPWSIAAIPLERGHDRVYVVARYQWLGGDIVETRLAATCGR